ncbi:hypothetical protein B0T10DRAFT_456602 [Thelonectria olida]|uniref:Uncharacterized protein n=1 Tax=Thelonectria olida TaxID=1576542 RepID=A0A9P8WCV9_9HYPO|nr:hypothetical protein B0T10DRAFT_456602 [Thelonectria olida]
MPSERRHLPTLSTLIVSLTFLTCAQSSELDPRSTDKPISGLPLSDKSYLPAQIGGLVGAYAVSLVLVAILLVSLQRTRRDHLTNGNEEADFAVPTKKDIINPDPVPQNPPEFASLNIVTNNLNAQNYDGLKTPVTPSPWISPSPVSSLGAPGVNPFVDQNRVAEDRNMAQSQLEDMYRHVLEHEDAKKRGVAYDAPVLPTPTHQAQSLKSPALSMSKKERYKPAGLNLRDEEKTQSRTSSLLSALRSPGRKKAMKAVSISSPIMTPQSATFPRHESQEMSAIPPRHYAPAAPPPPPMPQSHVSFGASRTQPTPADVSPESNLSIDERMGFQQPGVNRTQSHSRNVSQAPTDMEPVSATSEHSQSALVGLPGSPKPGSRFPTLPASPKPGQTFNRNNPSAVRTGGSLPLRAYEPAMMSPTTNTQTTKQTVFERRGPLSPGGGMTPFTATAVPYSPYQPFTPCVPMTPSLVTKQDRKRMRKMVPKTPTLAMVKSEDEVW